MENKHYIVCAVIIAFMSALSFALGLNYNKIISPSIESNPKSKIEQQFGSNSNRQMGGTFDGKSRMTGQRPLSGLVLSNSGSMITIKLNDGGSRIAITSGETVVSKYSQSTLDEIKVGSEVIISGDSNSDGSITAKNIQIK